MRMKEVDVSELLVVLNDGPVDDANVRVHLPSSPASILARRAAARAPEKLLRKRDIRAVSTPIPKEFQFQFLDCFWLFFWN